MLRTLEKEYTEAYGTARKDSLALYQIAVSLVSGNVWLARMTDALERLADAAEESTRRWHGRHDPLR